MLKKDRYSDSEQSDNSGGGGMFTGHDGQAAMNVYWSVAIFTSDWTSGQVGRSDPVKYWIIVFVVGPLAYWSIASVASILFDSCLVMSLSSMALDKTCSVYYMPEPYNIF